MELKNADSPTAETTRMETERPKNRFDPSTHCKNPKRMLVAPARKVPPRNRCRAPIFSMYLLNNGEKKTVVTKTQPYT